MLTEYQNQINNLDQQILDLMSLRQELVKLVAKDKLNLNLPTRNILEQKNNESLLISYGKNRNLKTKLIRRLWRFLDHESTKIQSEILSEIDRKVKLEAELLKINLRRKYKKIKK